MLVEKDLSEVVRIDPENQILQIKMGCIKSHLMSWKDKSTKRDEKNLEW